MGVTEKLVGFIVGTNFGDIPQEAIDIAKAAMLDCLGTTLAGSTEPAGEIIAQFVKEMGGEPKAGVVGHGFRTSLPNAALANGTMGHALDYDDVGGPIGHPTVVLLPGLLALGEWLKSSGRELLEAYLIGYEVGSKIGTGIGGQHYAQGWHSTATLGTMAAAAACAKLLKLDVEKTRLTLGLAASQAAGTRANFGTMTKPFHAGNANRIGVTSALLVRSGFTADENILERDMGFAALYSAGGTYDVNRMPEGLGNPFHILSPGLTFKFYPACFESHRTLDALLYLVEKHNLSPNMVESIECRAHPMIPQILIHSQPKAGLEGKFSMQYTLAAALFDGRVDLETFTTEKVLRPEVQAFFSKVKMNIDPSLDRSHVAGGPDNVTVKLKDGREYSHQVEWPKGHPRRPLTKDELHGKFRSCARKVLAEEDAQRVIQLMGKLENIGDVSTLMDIVTEERQ